VKTRMEDEFSVKQFPVANGEYWITLKIGTTSIDLTAEQFEKLQKVIVNWRSE